MSLRHGPFRHGGIEAHSPLTVAEVELELVPYGNNGAVSHIPLEAGMMSAAMLQTLTAQLTRPSGRVRHILKTPRSCPICVEVRGYALVGAIAPHAYERTATTNHRTFTRWWLDQTEREWRPRICPACLDIGGGAASEKAVCRRHLNERIAPGGVDLNDAVTTIITELQERLLDHTQLHLRGRTLPAPETTAAVTFLALGWLHGWAVPLALSAPATDEAALLYLHI